MRPGRGLLSLSPPKGREGDGENVRGGVRKRGGAYPPFAEKGWKVGQPGKDDEIFSQVAVGQEPEGKESWGCHV